MIRAAGASVVEEPLGAVSAVEDFVSERDGHATCDVYFSADIETDGPIPGEFSLLQFALVVAGTFDGTDFRTPERYDRYFVESVRPISERYEPEALRVNGLDRNRLQREGCDPHDAMSRVHDLGSDQRKLLQKQRKAPFATGIWRLTLRFYPRNEALLSSRVGHPSGCR